MDFKSDSVTQKRPHSTSRRCGNFGSVTWGCHLDAGMAWGNTGYGVPLWQGWCYYPGRGQVGTNEPRESARTHL